MRDINKLVIHCSASNFGSVDRVREWHVDGNGWSDIGYHYVVCNGYENKSDIFEDNVMNGEVQIGRPLGIVGAHVRGHNTGSIGICMIGIDEFTEEQFVGLGQLVIGLIEQFGLSVDDVYGHRDFDTHKTCPNFDVKLFISKYVLG